ncbi:hypothetical protein MPDQ_001308 [Monascus purpureus]|uniref:Chitin-binding type-4 domain-containing protein n=1 Tax=Monascus purpureus TaxID=5098 RepID=A0A507QQC3_MONPU|nr:hypothetical protein MPDQ_001308 [Monascus purpureus]BDD58783.1 hypothetical protein MAP00_004034 [Monascus purpureus]
MFFKSSLVAAALLAASAVEAHMMMSFPVPYSKDTLTNSPLAADGSDFPCKLRDNAFEPPAEPNEFPVGSTQKLTFVGSATHGGGSCQISLTTDLQPSKSSEWMVIKSFEGGCPANVNGNMAGGASTPDPYAFNFTIPDGISPGKYTLAWTWFNRIGNREMYMNCAPITVTGGSSKRSADVDTQFDKRSSSFPPMFVANINGCTTKEDVDIRFPNPGDDVAYLGEPSNLAPEGQPACTGTPTFGGAGDTAGASGSSPSGSSSSGSGSSSAASVPSSSVQAPAPVSTTLSVVASATPTGGVFAPVPSQASPSSASSSVAAAAPTSVVSPPSSTPSSASISILTGDCLPEGDWNCIGGTSFQRCASGKWSEPIQLAAGTQCAVGQAKELKISATSASSLKPRYMAGMRHSRRHVSHEMVHA